MNNIPYFSCITSFYSTQTDVREPERKLREIEEKQQRHKEREREKEMEKRDKAREMHITAFYSMIYYRGHTWVVPVNAGNLNFIGRNVTLFPCYQGN